VTEEEPTVVTSSMPMLILVGVVSAIVAAALAGGLVVAYENNQNSSTQSDLQFQIDNLKSQLAAEETATPTPTTTPTATATATETPSSTALTATSLGNATVVLSSTNYKLTNGTYTHSGTGPFGPGTFDSIALDSNHIAVDSANAGQAATVLTVTEEYPGAMGAGTFEELEVMTNSNNTPSYLARVEMTSLGATTATINNVTFASNVITVTYTTAGTSTTKTYKLSGSTLTEQ